MISFRRRCSLVPCPCTVLVSCSAVRFYDLQGVQPSCVHCAGVRGVTNPLCRVHSCWTFRATSRSLPRKRAGAHLAARIILHVQLAFTADVPTHSGWWLPVSHPNWLRVSRSPLLASGGLWAHAVVYCLSILSDLDRLRDGDPAHSGGWLPVSHTRRMRISCPPALVEGAEGLCARAAVSCFTTLADEGFVSPRTFAGGGSCSRAAVLFT